MNHRKNIIVLGLFLFSAAAVPALLAEKGYWKFTGERFVKGQLNPGDTARIDASGGGNTLTSTYSYKIWSSTATFTWKASKSVDILIPGDRITFTGTLTHSGSYGAIAGISYQPYGQRPGTGHISGRSIVAGFDNTVNRSVTNSGDMEVPDGLLYSDKRFEIRFEVSPSSATSGLYRTYEWIPGDAPPPGKPPVKEKPEEKKPAKPPQPPDKPDLHIDPDSIALAHTNFGGNPGWWHEIGHGDKCLKVLREPRADTQALTVQVSNRSPKATAKDVRLEVYLQLKGGDRKLAYEGTLGDIAPGGKTEFRDLFRLDGESYEGTLTCRVSTPGVEDLDEDDNTAGFEFGIYYAFQGGRGYSPILDGYDFPNYGWEEREGEELLEGLLASILTGIKLDAHALQVFQRLWFAGTWLDFAAANLLSTISGMGGHCYGMSATSAVYFEEPDLRPVPKEVWAMTMQEASYNIGLYHRAQIVPIFSMMVGDRLSYKLFPGPSRCYEDVKASLRDKREALILGFTNDYGPRVIKWSDGTEDVEPGKPMEGHAVLAYKMVDVSGRNPVIYVYDSNFPPGGWSEGDDEWMQAVEINLSRDEWSPGISNYDWVSPKHISAFRPHRKMPLDATSTRLINAVKEAYSKMIKSLDKANDLLAVLRCPADVLFVDAQGRRAGAMGGKIYREIPGAKVLSEGEVEMVRLPENGTYRLTIRGTGKGKLGLDIIRAAGPQEARLISFGEIPVQGGSQFTGTIERIGAIQALAGPGRSYEPLVVGTAKGDQVAWEKAPATFVVPPPPSRTSFPSLKAGKAARASKAAAAFEPKFGLSGQLSGPAVSTPRQPDWAGAWTTNFNRLILIQEGNRVTGTYAYKDGRLEGTVQGDVLQGTWIQSNGKGRFEFRLSADGRSFSGKWGNGDTLTGGPWNGTR